MCSCIRLCFYYCVVYAHFGPFGHSSSTTFVHKDSYWCPSSPSALLSRGDCPNSSFLESKELSNHIIGLAERAVPYIQLHVHIHGWLGELSRHRFALAQPALR